jgi:Flp pilus assembly protein TadG
VIIALMLAAILGFAAIAVDLTSAMSDRRIVQATADSAALAGARSYPHGTDAAHRVAMQYLAKQLGFTLPLGSCTAVGTCPAGTYTAGSYTITLQDDAPALALDVSVRHRQQTLLAGVLGSGFATVTSGASGRAAALQQTLYSLAALSGDAQVNGGGTTAPSGDVEGPVYVGGSFGSNNGPHSPTIPTVQYGYNGQPCPNSAANHLDNGGSTNSLHFQWTPATPAGTDNTSVSPPSYLFTGPTASGPTYTSTGSAKDSLGNWNPGTYSGVFPSGGKMNAGVYQIVNVKKNISLGTIANLTPAPSGVLDTSGAVAIVLDATDTGNLDVSNANLNGVDDLGSGGTRDPEGTHNFVLYGQGYKGNVSIGSNGNASLTGIVYLPSSQLSFNGNATAKFTGSVIVASMSVTGGGNGSQTFDWICDLQAVDSSHPFDGGLIR